MQNTAIDIVQLNRYTGGNETLNAEILRLFRDQSEGLLSRLPGILTTADTRAWRETLHTLKGAARSIGAFPLADSTERAETIQPKTDSAYAALRKLETEAAEVRLYIDKLLAEQTAPA